MVLDLLKIYIIIILYINFYLKLFKKLRSKGSLELEKHDGNQAAKSCIKN